jgi:hypothetical protein
MTQAATLARRFCALVNRALSERLGARLEWVGRGQEP